MIKNQRQYLITQKNAAIFAEALARLSKEECPNGVDPIIHRAKIAGMESEFQTLRREVEEYEALQSGQVGTISLNSLEELPLGLIKARIARNLTQKQLAEKMGVKPQQVQRWEHDEYENVAFSNLVEIAEALELNISECIQIPEKPKPAFSGLKQLGIDKSFIKARLVPTEIKYKFNELSDGEVLTAAGAWLNKIFGVCISIDGLISNDNRLQLAGQGARFRIPSNADQNKVRAYALYAQYLANIVANTACHIPVRPIPQTWQDLRKALCGEARPTFECLVRGAWDLGIAVLPLADPIRFHGVCWRFAGRNVVILKQSTRYSSRWSFDLLHEICHAGEEPESKALKSIEIDATDPRRRESGTEKDADELAGDILLMGQAEELYGQVLSAARGLTSRIKSAVEKIGDEKEVNTADLANYVAYRLKTDNFIEWWGTAANLQPQDEDPLEIARKVLREKVDLSKVSKEDRELLEQALSEPFLG